MTGVENKSEMDSLVNKKEKYFARVQALYVVGRKDIDLVSKKQPYTTELDTFVSRFQRIEDNYEQTIDDFNNYDQLNPSQKSHRSL